MSNSQPVTLLSLPQSLQEKILSQTSPATVCRVSVLCRDLRAAAAQDSLWRTFYDRQWDEPLAHAAPGSWRDRFRKRWAQCCKICDAEGAAARICGSCADIELATALMYDV